jgi:hypothetical protein
MTVILVEGPDWFVSSLVVLLNVFHKHFTFYAGPFSHVSDLIYMYMYGGIVFLELDRYIFQ